MPPSLAQLEQSLEVGESSGPCLLPHDPALDDIARLAAQVCDAPASLVTLAQGNTAVILGRFGMQVEPLSRHTTPCAITVQAEGVYQIPDARRDPAYAPIGIVVGETVYRSYAGTPVYDFHGAAIGCVCVLDRIARTLSPAQVKSLDSLSQMASTRLELGMRDRDTQRATRDRQHVEAALTTERNFVATVLDTVGALVVVFDPGGRIVRFNRACEITSGYPADDLLGSYTWERLIPPEDVFLSIEDFEKLRRGNFPVTFENRWRAADGTDRRISWSATALLDPCGQVSYIIATGLDVTVQRVAEGAICETESRYREIVEGSLGLVFTHDLEGTILSVNEHGARSFGREVGAVLGRKLGEFLHSNRRSFMPGYLHTLKTAGKSQGMFHLNHADGGERVLAYRNRLVQPIAGAPYVLGFAIDITDQVRAEEQLHALIRQSNSVLESIGDGIYGVDLEGRVTVVNPAAAQMLGYRPEELLGRNMHELIHYKKPDGTPYPEVECPIRGSVRHLNSIRVAHEVFWRKDGTSFPVEYVARPQIEAESAGLSAGSEAARGRAVGVVVAFTDISERYALDKMKDEFISAVSHELRTPLTSLRAALELISGGALQQRPEKAERMMEIAVGNADRLTRLVNDILDLERIGSGKSHLHLCSCSVEELFRRATNSLEKAAEQANVRFTIEPNDVVIWCDPDRILQMLTHLIANAIKFSPSLSATPHEIRLTATSIMPEEALIEIEDHGRGIPADQLQAIFERFRQVDASDTREIGGTGLGLAICRSITRQHGGQIWATSTLGQGSIFHVTLPMQPNSNLR